MIKDELFSTLLPSNIYGRVRSHRKRSPKLSIMKGFAFLQVLIMINKYKKVEWFHLF